MHCPYFSSCAPRYISACSFLVPPVDERWIRDLYFPHLPSRARPCGTNGSKTLEIRFSEIESYRTAGRTGNQCISGGIQIECCTKGVGKGPGLRITMSGGEQGKRVCCGARLRSEWGRCFGVGCLIRHITISFVPCGDRALARLDRIG